MQKGCGFSKIILQKKNLAIIEDKDNKVTETPSSTDMTRGI